MSATTEASRSRPPWKLACPSDDRHRSLRFPSTTDTVYCRSCGTEYDTVYDMEKDEERNIGAIRTYKQ